MEILSTVRKAMADDATLLIIDTVIPPGNEPSHSKLIDMEMLILNGGQERTKEEFETVLNAAGFNLTQILPTQSFSSLIEASPAR